LSLIAALALQPWTQASGSELRVAVAPRITLPKDSPAFTEDSASFYGTNIALLVSKFLRARVEAQLRKPIPSSLRVEANRVPNTTIIAVVASGVEDSVASAFLSALFDQFNQFKHEQKAKYYRDAIATVDSALTYIPPEYVQRLQLYREQLVLASVLDVKPDFERVEY
jgi:hypothetical protein